MGQGVSRFQVSFMVVTCILVIGNLYYNQPLLGILAREFAVSEKTVSLVPALTLVGYAIGILLLVPLGDMMERRKLLQVSMTAAGSLALALAFTSSFAVLCALSFAMGFFNVSATVLIPFSANLAKPQERGKVMGTVMSGILLGSLMARTLSGFMAEHFGWKSIFIFAGSVNLLLAVATQWALPASVPQFSGSYKALLHSTWGLIRDLPLVREAALMGAILFGSFSAFWTTLTFLLEGEPFNYTPQTIGLFGLLGMIGALAAPLAGRYADKKGTAATIRLGLYCSMGAFALLALSSKLVLGVILGVLILDLGIQVAHISNQARVFELSAEARSRLSSIYVFCYFIGGSLGSWIGSLLWSWGKWPAVSLGGLVFCGAANLLFRRGQKVRATAQKIA
ncbi:MFS transporter [Bdellovibrio sp. 22V]|uniref:MFS transporter n=1 Tax=Bdellovibrio sp. 22V TaxID=3044166 RepID=UPI002542B023|nr:MFS transporter [Bdellovibrio sp. 22V]WII73557.1 MFS transporter [Bdellovibrio sp. 22V]